ncbi:Uncharacterised protein [Vibrio cholerae]|nr:Uncharacterised protein [Vibrio cholerae]CSI51283.1 Uncharacterised protein [Vibrio cholerae]
MLKAALGFMALFRREVAELKFGQTFVDFD